MSCVVQSKQITGLTEEVDALKSEIEQKDKIIGKLSRTCNDQLSRMKREVDENTKERKNRNMVINGLPETPNENCSICPTISPVQFVWGTNASDLQSKLFNIKSAYHEHYIYGCFHNGPKSWYIQSMLILPWLIFILFFLSFCIYMMMGVVFKKRWFKYRHILKYN